MYLIEFDIPVLVVKFNFLLGNKLLQRPTSSEPFTPRKVLIHSFGAVQCR